MVGVKKKLLKGVFFFGEWRMGSSVAMIYTHVTYVTHGSRITDHESQITNHESLHKQNKPVL